MEAADRNQTLRMVDVEGPDTLGAFAHPGGGQVCPGADERVATREDAGTVVA